LRAELLRHSVLHADETPAAMLKPGNRKTHRACLWSYCTTTYSQTKAVVFDFADSRAGQYARDFLGLPGQDGLHGSLVCDDFSGYELDAAQRKRIRQERARPVADALHLWLAEQRKKVPEGSATAKAIDYSLGRSAHRECSVTCSFTGCSAERVRCAMRVTTTTNMQVIAAITNCVDARRGDSRRMISAAARRNWRARSCHFAGIVRSMRTRNQPGSVNLRLRRFFILLVVLHWVGRRARRSC
jgi:hypothetical protein